MVGSRYKVKHDSDIHQYRFQKSSKKSVVDETTPLLKPRKNIIGKSLYTVASYIKYGVSSVYSSITQCSIFNRNPDNEYVSKTEFDEYKKDVNEKLENIHNQLRLECKYFSL